MGPWASQDILGDFGSLDPGSNPGGSVQNPFLSYEERKVFLFPKERRCWIMKNLVFFVVIGLVIFSSMVIAENLSFCEQHHIITIDDNTSAKLKIIVFNNPQDKSIVKCDGFTFPESWNITNLIAYEFESNRSLDIIRARNNSELSLWINWTSSGCEADKRCPFVIEFELSNYIVQTYDEFYHFWWSWGNSGYDLPINYTFKLNKKFQYLEKITREYKVSNIIVERKIYLSTPAENILYQDNYTSITFNGKALKGEYFKVSGLFEDFKPPSLKISKEIKNPGVIYPEQTVVIVLTITNTGYAKAVNIRLKPKNDPTILVPIDESDTNISELDPNKIEKKHFYFKSLLETEGENIGADELEYYDVWGDRYSTTSNSPKISITKKKEEIVLPFINIPVAREDALYIFIVFVSGYLCSCFIIVFGGENREKQYYKLWKEIPFFDKVIISTVLAISNVVISGIFMLLLFTIISLLGTLGQNLIGIEYVHNPNIPEFLIYPSLIVGIFTSYAISKGILRWISRRTNKRWGGYILRIITVLWIALIALFIIILVLIVVTILLILLLNNGSIPLIRIS